MTEADSVALRSGPVCLINSSAAWRQVVATVPPLAVTPIRLECVDGCGWWRPHPRLRPLAVL